jgi:hypothetical protein
MKAVTTTMTRLRVLFAALLLCTFAASAASAEFVNVYGGPTYDGATQTGYLTAVQPAAPGDTAGNGAAVGYATKYSSGTSIGTRAYRWDASGSAAVELGNLGTSGNGMTNVRAYALNGAGLVVGWASKYTSGVDLGNRAVRWAASGTAATELGNLGTYLGSRAVRWDALGTVTELGNLGTTGGGTFCRAYAMNDAGATVGWANEYEGGTYVGDRAVLWNSDGVAFDLNTLIDPDSGWTLFEADGISDTNWVSGIGLFDPDGAGPLGAYDRAFLLDASSAVPESASFCLLACASTLLTLRRGRSAQLPAAAGIPTSKSSAGVRSPRLTVVMTLSGLIDVRNSLTHQVAGTSTQSLRPRESNPAFTNSTCYAREGESLRGFDRGARYC